MEPALPPFHPKLPELLDRLQLRVVDAFKWNTLACAPTDQSDAEPTVVLKFGATPAKSELLDYEMRVLRDVLPSLDQELFERLTFPELVAHGVHEELRWMTTRFIKGRSLVHDWSEYSFKSALLGGKAIGTDTARIAVDVLRDLRSVDIRMLPAFVRRFDFVRWLEDFGLKSETLVAKGLAERRTVDAASRLFAKIGVRRYEGSMFTNGNFYPRNFIMLGDGKVALVEWVGGVDPWEFVAMHAWLLMWGNPQWQIAYADQIKKHFPVDIAEMQTGLLVKSFELAYRWRDLPEENVGLARSQMLAYFHECLDEDYVRDLFSL